MNLDDALQTFIVESHELLQSMEDALLDIEHSDDPVGSINAIFRAAHTIKGSAGLFGLDAIVGFTHVMESVLDKVRGGELRIDDPMVALLLSCGDHIKALLGSLVAGEEHLDAALSAAGTALVARLSGYLGGTAGQGGKGTLPQQVETKVETVGGGTVETDNWHISLHFGPDVLRNGMDPLSFLRYLGTLGQIVGLSTLFDAMPAAADMDPESCYLSFEIGFKSDADKAAIEGAFEFVREDCVIHILPPKSRIADYVQLIQYLPEEDMRLGDILVRCGSLTPHELESVLAFQAGNEQPSPPPGSGEERAKPIGEIVTQAGIVHAPVVQAALEKQKAVRDAKTQESRVIRVDSEKLDSLINLVGELVIAGAAASLLSKKGGDDAMQEVTSNIARLVEEIRDDALSLRMVQIGETFSHFQRIVRDVPRAGQGHRAGDPRGRNRAGQDHRGETGRSLMHLVRNAIDHGIEPAELRRASGKPATGTVRLNAYHESGSIVIEVSDDGAGLNRDRILKKAREHGLVSPGQVLSDHEIHMLIFEAGFSTAEQITNLSGRGVGMDVVRRNIEALRGTCELDSEEGGGSVVRIRLPLTLAIIDGFLMGVGAASYVVPLEMVKECVELGEKEREEAREHNYVDLRGEVLPFIRLREHFREDGKAGRRENVVVVQYGNQKAGLVVDELMGEFQAVIKPLGRLFGNLRGISGSTILGSGEVALILDVPALIQQAVSGEARTAPAQASHLERHASPF